MTTAIARRLLASRAARTGQSATRGRRRSELPEVRPERSVRIARYEMEESGEDFIQLESELLMRHDIWAEGR